MARTNDAEDRDRERDRYEMTGRQDCDNTFGVDDIDYSSGNTAEEIVDKSLQWMTLEEWTEQNEDVEDETSLSFKDAYEAWRDGWRSCAITHVQQSMPYHLTKAEKLFQDALRSPGAQSVDVAQDVALENKLSLCTFAEKTAELNNHYTIDVGSVGDFEIDPNTYVSWEATPDRRNDPGTGLLVMNYSFRGQTWSERIGMSGTGLTEALGGAPRADVDLYASREWRRRGCEYAWHAVKVFKDEDEGLGKKKLTHEILDIIKERCKGPLHSEPETAEELYENPGKTKSARHDSRDKDNAVDKYREFNSFDPKKLVYVDGSPIPTKLRCLGEATQIVYESMKVIPDNGVKPRKPQGYFHDHEGDVKTYVPDPRGDTDTPDFVLECDALALIGTCLGFTFKDDDGKEGKGKATRPYPEVYCTPNGRALLIVQGKKTVLAIIYGGALGVESRGIVG